jgi:hypothetical protein
LGRIRDFYWEVWFENSGTDKCQPSSNTELRCCHLITQDSVTTFLRALNFDQTNGIVNCNDVPIDYAIVASWKAIIKALWDPKLIQGDLLKLVHKSNEFKLLNGFRYFRAGDVIETEAQITAIINEENGKLVCVRALCCDKEKKPLLQITSEFFYRGHFTDFENTFEHKEWPPFEFKIQSKTELEVLTVKPWIIWNDNDTPKVGDTIVFRVRSYSQFKSRNEYSTLKIEGIIERCRHNQQMQQIGRIDGIFHNTKVNPIESFFKSWAK